MRLTRGKCTHLRDNTHSHTLYNIKHKIHIENCSQHQPALQMYICIMLHSKISPRRATKQLIAHKATPTLLLRTPSTRSTRPGSFTRPLVGEVFLLFSFSFSSLVIDLQTYESVNALIKQLVQN